MMARYVNVSEDDKTQSSAQCQVCSNKLIRQDYKRNDHFLAVNYDQVGTLVITHEMLQSSQSSSLSPSPYQAL
jgi:hypothetical protein